MLTTSSLEFALTLEDSAEIARSTQLIASFEDRNIQKPCKMIALYIFILDCETCASEDRSSPRDASGVLVAVRRL